MSDAMSDASSVAGDVESVEGAESVEGVEAAPAAAPGKRAKSVSRSARAGLIFPIGRVAKRIRQQSSAKRLGATAAVYTAALLEYLTSELIIAAVAKRGKKMRITPRHIQLAVRDDEDLDTLLQSVTIAHSGVVPHIEAALLRSRHKRSFISTPADRALAAN